MDDVFVVGLGNSDPSEKITQASRLPVKELRINP